VTTFAAVGRILFTALIGSSAANLMALPPR